MKVGKYELRSPFYREKEKKEVINEMIETEIIDKIENLQNASEISTDGGESEYTEHLKDIKSLVEIRNENNKGKNELDENKKNRKVKILTSVGGLVVLVGVHFIDQFLGYGFDYEGGITSNTLKDGKKNSERWIHDGVKSFMFWK